MKTSIFALCILCSPAFADVKLPAIFSDLLVLQREASVPVWGTADPGEEVSVTIAGQTQTAKGDVDGKWRVELNKLAAGKARRSPSKERIRWW